MKPCVSIIVPVCNVENYLKECMDSILRQTLKNIEIICIDDGSTDGSLGILREYEKKDNRVKVISKDNSGYGNTMNVGFDAAKSDYIGIVESDDYVDPNMFKELYENAIMYDADVVKSDHYIFSTKNGKKNCQLQRICPDEYYGRVLNAEICEAVFDFVMMNWTGVYKKDFIEEKKIRHNETPGASFQDNGFWFQVFTQAKKIVFLNKAFYYYRQDNPNSSINNKNKVFTICEEYAFIQRFILENELLRERYFNTFFRKKVFNYLHTYHRLLTEYKMAFLERAAKEFEDDLKCKYLHIAELDPWLLEQVNRIVDSTEMYYLEDSQYELRKEYEKIHSLLMEIRGSKEFVNGLKVKKILGM